MSSELNWFKSSHSDGEGGACVEVANGQGTVHVRDSKNPEGPTLRIRRDAWRSFVAARTP
ncbi:DUF397 domain-containing protein [Streptomyces sp. NPDC048172]|uniref:DUF397 domain-containing protein n=1 Tax=Streptomyces sp. NPDC048172 TaxID=3365505 RepID=UPI003720F50C